MASPGRIRTSDQPVNSRLRPEFGDSVAYRGGAISDRANKIAVRFQSVHGQKPPGLTGKGYSIRQTMRREPVRCARWAKMLRYARCIGLSKDCVIKMQTTLAASPRNHRQSRRMHQICIPLPGRSVQARRDGHAARPVARRRRASAQCGRLGRA
jgi:hypothetical protein